MNWYGISKEILYLLAHQKKKSLFSVVNSVKLIYTFGNDHNRRIARELFKKKKLRLMS